MYRYAVVVVIQTLYRNVWLLSPCTTIALLSTVSRCPYIHPSAVKEQYLALTINEMHWRRANVATPGINPRAGMSAHLAQGSCPKCRLACSLPYHRTWLLLLSQGSSSRPFPSSPPHTHGLLKPRPGLLAAVLDGHPDLPHRSSRCHIVFSKQYVHGQCIRHSQRRRDTAYPLDNHARLPHRVRMRDLHLPRMRDLSWAKAAPHASAACTYSLLAPTRNTTAYTFATKEEKETRQTKVVGGGRERVKLGL